MASKVTCTCGWSWNKSDSSKKDMYVCHQCGKDNTMKNGGWLSKFDVPEAENGIEGTMGGLTDKGFNYNGAWGGTMAMGGSIPGSVGFTYARTQDPAPSNGKYAKKTMASAQNGQEMKFYQEGLDWKPKNISKDGSSLPEAQTGRKLKYELNKPISAKQDATKVVPINKMTSEQAKKLQAQKDYQEILRRKEAIALSQEARNKPLSIQNIADESGAIGDKYRIYPNDPNSFVDEYLNPGVQIGNMASALGRIPLNLQEGNYGQAAIAIGTPLAMGTLAGIQAQNTGQFANNLLNPLAGISSIDSKSLSKIKPTSQVQKISNYDEIPFDINNLSQKDKSLIDLYSTESGPFHTDLEKIKQLDELINKTKGGEFPLIRHFSDNPTFKAGLREKDLLESSGELLSPRPLSFSAFEGLDDFGKNRMLLTKPENQSYLKIGNDFMEENEIVLPSNLKYKVNKKEPNKLGGIDYHVNFKQGGWLSKYEDGGIIEDDRGQLEYPGEITKINSNQITMQGVDYPVLGISDTGDTQMMQPGQDYIYEGESVTEIPMMQKGGNASLRSLMNDDGLKSKSDATKVVPQKTMTKEQAAKLKAKKDAEELQRRKTAIETSNAARNKSFSVQNLADESGAIGDKLRMFPNDPDSFIDEYINPGVMIGNMASGLGRVPLNIQEGNYGQAAVSVATPLITGALGGIGAKNTKQFVNNLVNPFAGTGDLAKGVLDKRVASSIDNVVQPITPKPWQIEELPGLHLKSTMEGEAISRIIESKTGLINTEQALAIIGKESGGADKVALIRQGLGDNVPKKMDFNDFRKTVQDQLIPLEKQFSTERSDYGIDRLGYNEGNFTKTTVGDRIVHNLESDLIENQTLILGNKNRFGRGSSAHGNPDETLGHAHFLRDAETPDVLTVTQIQSDAFQGTHRIMPKNAPDASKAKKSLERMQEINERNRSVLNKMKNEGLDEVGLPVQEYQIKQFEDIVKGQESQNIMKKGEVKNFTQKSLLDKNHQERYLQELVDYAGKRGDLNKIRIPTSETAAKVQGYTPVSTVEDVLEEYNKIKGTKEFDTQMAQASEWEKTKIKKMLSGEIKGNIYDQEHETILRKYLEQPKTIKKLFGKEPTIVTDGKGNTWYEFDIPKKFKEGKGEIKAFGLSPFALPTALGLGAASQIEQKNGGWLSKYN
jgi:hypothetical protein